MGILGPVAALQIYGTYDQLKDKLSSIDSSFMVLDKVPTVSKDLLAKIRSEAEPYMSKLNWLAERMRDAEDELKDAGLVFDGKTVKAIGQGKGARRHLFNELVESFYEEYKWEYWEKTDEENSSEVRQRISQELAWYFSKELIDPSSKGPIWTAIDNYLKRENRRRDQID